MPIYHGSTAIGAIYHGATAIGRVYKGDTLVWEKPASAPEYRASRMERVTSSSIVFEFPTGSLEGDRCLIFTHQAWAVNTPSGWTEVDKQSGSNINGAVFTKVLTSTDISTGSVTITYSGGFNGHVSAVTFIGAPTIVTDAMTRHSGNINDVTATTDTTPQTGDYALCYRGDRNAGILDCTIGDQLEQDSQSNSTMVLNIALVGSNGAFSATFRTAPGGADFASPVYYGIVVVRP